MAAFRVVREVDGLVLRCLLRCHSVLFGPAASPADFLPYNRGADLATADGLVLFDHRYEEVTDSLLRLSAERPLVAVVAREGLTAAGLSKLEHFRRQSARRQLRLCLWTLPGREAGSGLESYYADVVTLKSLVRADAGFLVVEDGMVRAKRNLSAFRPERFGRPVTVPQLVEEDAGLPYRHAGCVAAGLLLIAAVRRHEKVCCAPCGQWSCRRGDRRMMAARSCRR